MTCEGLKLLSSFMGLITVGLPLHSSSNSSQIESPRHPIQALWNLLDRIRATSAGEIFFALQNHDVEEPDQRCQECDQSRAYWL